MTKAKKEKVNFRNSKRWRDFRVSLLKEADYRCELCGGYFRGKKSKNLQIHHLFPEDYESLNPVDFSVLCSTDHKLVERINVKLLAKKDTLIYKDIWLSLIRRFLPYSTIDYLESKNEEKS